MEADVPNLAADVKLVGTPGQEQSGHNQGEAGEFSHRDLLAGKGSIFSPSANPTVSRAWICWRRVAAIVGTVVKLIRANGIQHWLILLDAIDEVAAEVITTHRLCGESSHRAPMDLVPAKQGSHGSWNRDIGIRPRFTGVVSVR